jgi:hypothetical protein
MLDFAKDGKGRFGFPGVPGTRKSYCSKKYAEDGRNWGMTRNPDTIRKYWKDHPDANVCLVTGAINRLFVIDVDTVEGHKNLTQDGQLELDKLIADNGGEWPITPMVRSPSGSVHYYFRWPDGDGITISNNNTGKVGPGIDVLGDNGMVLAPPSVKPDVGCYEWLTGPEIKPANAPQWLLDLVVEKVVPHEPSEPQAPTEKLAAAMDLIPNEGLNAEWCLEKDDGTIKKFTGWGAWNNFGMALYRASGGSAEGRKIWMKFSAKNKDKYNEEDAAFAWDERYRKSLPTKIGAGTIFKIANYLSSNWSAVWDEEHPEIVAPAYAGAADIVAISYQPPRPTIKVPLNDAPKMPVMNQLNKVLAASPADKPPARGLNGTMTRVAKMRIPHTHAFSADDANAEHPEDNKNKLPAPDQYLLLTMNDLETAELIEQHIDFINGKGRSVCLPIPFIKHYRTRTDEKLPTVAAIALAPIVLASGELLAPKGLDRTRGIVFEIPDQVRAIMPRPVDCTDAAVAEAMRFLCDEWLCDVLTDYHGKCIIIAAALTMIERSLLPDRPAFWVTAGRRGGGKTTTLSMLISAITGNLPAASAWSTNEEERRKAIMAQFMFGAPYILWDNITRGSQINCPHIEKSCTSAFYSDRKLGVSEIVTTSASTIHFFTGNNVGPRGDLASRSLKVEINVDRPDPENRVFQHADPIGWTENHRASLVRAFYTILIGNPQLKTKRNAPSKTRFKLWWRLVGAAVEHAAKQHSAATPIDFEIIFRSQEDTEDEESLTLAEVLNALSQRWPKGLVASDVAGVINDARSFNSNASADSVFSGMLQGFLYPTIQHDRYVSPRSVGKQLGKHRNNPVRYDQQQVLTLRSRSDHSVVKGSLEYFIEVKAV